MDMLEKPSIIDTSFIIPQAVDKPYKIKIVIGKSSLQEPEAILHFNKLQHITINAEEEEGGK